MSDMLSYIQNNPQETQRLIGIKSEQLEELIKQALALHTQKQQDIEIKKIRIIPNHKKSKIKKWLPTEYLSNI